MKLNEMSGTGGGVGGVGGGSFTSGTGMGVATKPAFKKKKRKKRNPYKLTNMMNEIYISPPFKPEIGQKYKFLYRGEWIDNPYTFIGKDKYGNYVFKCRKHPELGTLIFNDKILSSLKLKYNVQKVEEINESLTYSKFRNEVKTRTKQQQLHRSVKEVQKRLNEINKVLEYTNRMRNEITENGSNVKYSRFTEQALKQIKEMAINLYKNIKELKK